MKKDNPSPFFWQKFVEIYQQTFSMLKENPTIWILFVLLGIFDFAALAILYFAPSAPVSMVVAPIIRTFWDDRYLHYPENFMLLPRLFNHAHFLILSIFGVAITGMAIKKIEAHAHGEHLSTLSAAGAVFKKYFSLVAAWLLFYAVFMLSLKNIMMFLPRAVWIQLSAGFFLGLAIQALFAFLLPALLISDKGLFRDLWQGFLLGGRYFFLTCLLIAIPMAVVVMLSFFKALTPLIVQIYPEMVLGVLAIGIVISLLVDLFVTISTTLLYLKVREKS